MTNRVQHEAPDWIDGPSTYFVTICAEPRGTNHFCHSELAPFILKSTRQYHEERKWFCSLALVMPDHIHLLLRTDADVKLATRVSSWKRWISRHYSIPWQANFFDHRLRNEESRSEKGDYILQNPVRAGLAERAEDWPYVWIGS